LIEKYEEASRVIAVTEAFAVSEVSSTIARTPLALLESLIAAALAIAEALLREVETLSSAATVARIVDELRTRLAPLKAVPLTNAFSPS
jgi:hypothetical protein